MLYETKCRKIIHTKLAHIPINMLKKPIYYFCCLIGMSKMSVLLYPTTK